MSTYDSVLKFIRNAVATGEVEAAAQTIAVSMDEISRQLNIWIDKAHRTEIETSNRTRAEMDRLTLSLGNRDRELADLRKQMEHYRNEMSYLHPMAMAFKLSEDWTRGGDRGEVAYRALLDAQAAAKESYIKKRHGGLG